MKRVGSLSKDLNLKTHWGEHSVVRGVLSQRDRHAKSSLKWLMLSWRLYRRCCASSSSLSGQRHRETFTLARVKQWGSIFRKTSRLTVKSTLCLARKVLREQKLYVYVYVLTFQFSLSSLSPYLICTNSDKLKKRSMLHNNSRCYHCLPDTLLLVCSPCHVIYELREKNWQTDKQTNQQNYRFRTRKLH